MPASLLVGLVHFPVRDRAGRPMVSTVTNLDIHDLARSCRTYGAMGLAIVHPLESQQDLVKRIVGHWTHGGGSQRIPDRADALARVHVVASIEDAKALLGPREEVEVWVTAARAERPKLPFAEARARLRGDDRKILLLFGTAWGLCPEVVDQAHALLPAISAESPTDYNHLSVRAACAITLDRLLGP